MTLFQAIGMRPTHAEGSSRTHVVLGFGWGFASRCNILIFNLMSVIFGGGRRSHVAGTST